MEIIRELRNLNMTTKHVMLGKTPSIQYTWHTRTGAVFGGIRHGDIYSAMYDAGITPTLVMQLLKAFSMKRITSTTDMKHIILP